MAAAEIVERTNPEKRQRKEKEMGKGGEKEERKEKSSREVALAERRGFLKKRGEQSLA